MSGSVRFSDMTSTFASFHLRARSAIQGSHASAARTPGTLFAAIDVPVPVQQNSIPSSASPAATERATRAATSGHRSRSRTVTSWPRLRSSSTTASATAPSSSAPMRILTALVLPNADLLRGPALHSVRAVVHRRVRCPAASRRERGLRPARECPRAARHAACDHLRQGLDGALDSGRRRRAPRRPDGRRRNGLRNRDLLCADAERPDEEGNRRAAHGPAQHAGPRGARAEPLRARLCRGGREDLLDARRGRGDARRVARLGAFVPPRTYSYLTLRMERTAKATALAAALLGLLVLVAMAARGGHPGTSGHVATRAVPNSVQDSFVTLVAIAYLVGIVAIVFGFFRYKHRWHDPGSHWLANFVGVCVLMAIATGIGYYAIRHGHWHTHAAKEQTAQGGQPLGQERIRHLPATPARTAHFEWPVVLALGGLALLGAVWMYVRGRRRLAPLLEDHSLQVDMIGAIETTIDGLRSERDPRRAVIAAYALMERTLAAH